MRPNADRSPTGRRQPVAGVRRCPFCGAQPGEYCTQASSTVPASRTHEARLRVWREELRVWREEHAARVPKSNTEPWFVAKYAGTCARCRDRIEPGQEIQANS